MSLRLTSSDPAAAVRFAFVFSSRSSRLTHAGLVAADQLFLADPIDASVVYCSSDVFAVASPSASEAADATDVSSSSNGADASVSVSVSTTVEAETITLNHVETVTSEAPAATARSSAFHSARRPLHSLGPAIAPGSPQDQGFGLVVRSGASLASVAKQGTLLFTTVAAAALFL